MRVDTGMYDDEPVPEPVLGIELAGHSGPADWVMEVFFVAFMVLIEALLLISYRRARRRAAKSTNSAAL